MEAGVSFIVLAHSGQVLAAYATANTDSGDYRSWAFPVCALRHSRGDMP
jgi:hypothetical protein